MMPCLECLEAVEDIMPPPPIVVTMAHDAYGWDVVTRQESDDLVGTVPVVKPKHDE